MCACLCGGCDGCDVHMCACVCMYVCARVFWKCPTGEKKREEEEREESRDKGWRNRTECAVVQIRAPLSLPAAVDAVGEERR